MLQLHVALEEIGDQIWIAIFYTEVLSRKFACNLIFKSKMSEKIIHINFSKYQIVQDWGIAFLHY